MKDERPILPQYTPRPYFEERNRFYGYTTAIWRRTFHFMGRAEGYGSMRDDPVWARVELGYGIGAQALKRPTITTDHTILTDPLCLSITFDHAQGGGAMGRGVLDILASKTRQADEIAEIAEGWHLNSLISRCDCMPFPYPPSRMREDAPKTYSRRLAQRCIVTEIGIGTIWWHRPLPDALIATICGWHHDASPGANEGYKETIIDGKIASWEQIYPGSRKEE
jgi:hypothetical protein